MIIKHTQKNGYTELSKENYDTTPYNFLDDVLGLDLIQQYYEELAQQNIDALSLKDKAVRERCDALWYRMYNAYMDICRNALSIVNHKPQHPNCRTFEELGQCKTRAYQEIRSEWRQQAEKESINPYIDDIKHYWKTDNYDDLIQSLDELKQIVLNKR